MGNLGALEEFASSPTAEAQSEAVLTLLKNKDLHRAIDTPAFRAGFERLGEHTANVSAASSRLVALATLGRIGAVSKSTQPSIAERLRQTLREPLPSLQELRESDDRFYVAGMWRYVRHPWMPEYLADAAVQEDAGESARLECLLGLMTLSVDLAASLSILGAALPRMRFDTKKPGDSRGRRVRKILSQTTNAAVQLKVPSGDGVGTALSRLLTEAVPRKATPESEQVAMALVDEVAALLNYVVRSKLSLVTQPDTYAALDVMRSWIPGAEWPDLAERSSGLKSVAEDIKEGLRIVVRAGRTDDGLYRALANATGSTDQARREAIAIESELPGLDEGVRAWLEGKTGRRSSEFAMAERERSADEVFGALLLDARALAAQGALVADVSLPELQMLTPRAAPVLSRLLGTLASALSKVELLGAKRNLRLRGDVGAVLEYSPLEHEMAGGFVSGVRMVRLLTPVIEVAAQGELARVVRKALVEPVADPS